MTDTVLKSNKDIWLKLNCLVEVLILIQRYVWHEFKVDLYESNLTERDEALLLFYCLRSK